MHDLTEYIRNSKIQNNGSRGKRLRLWSQRKKKKEYPVIKRLPTERQSVVSLSVAVLLGRTCEEGVVPPSLFSHSQFWLL
jgi:hypothetical protein